jgi:hypothetical protein
MADTIVNTPSSGESGAGWFVAVIILLAVVGGAFLWFTQYGMPQVSNPGETNINVTIPTPAADPGAVVDTNKTP